MRFILEFIVPGRLNLGFWTGESDSFKKMPLVCREHFRDGPPAKFWIYCTKNFEAINFCRALGVGSMKVENFVLIFCADGIRLSVLLDAKLHSAGFFCGFSVALALADLVYELDNVRRLKKACARRIRPAPYS